MREEGRGEWIHGLSSSLFQVDLADFRKISEAEEEGGGEKRIEVRDSPLKKKLLQPRFETPKKDIRLINQD